MDEQTIARIARALETMYQTTGILPGQEKDTAKIFVFLKGEIARAEIDRAIHQRIVFCGDCNHVVGANRDCEDGCRAARQRASNSQFHHW